MSHSLKTLPDLIGFILFGFTLFHAWDVSTLVKRHTYKATGGFPVHASAAFGFLYVATMLSKGVIAFFCNLALDLGIYRVPSVDIVYGVSITMAFVMLFFVMKVLDNILKVASVASHHNYMNITNE